MEKDLAVVFLSREGGLDMVVTQVLELLFDICSISFLLQFCDFFLFLVT